MMKIAVSQYSIDKFNWESYVNKINSLISEVKKNDVQLLILPEYAGIEIGGDGYNSDEDLFFSVQSHLSQYIEYYKELSRENNLYILSGSIPVKISENKFVNRAYFFGPNDSFGYQDKLQLTEYEKSSRILTTGSQQTIFDTSFGKIGIAVCYDSEFPEIVRSLVYAGAKLILVPSYCNSNASYHRVSLSCRARAIENQCYVAVSYVVGAVSSGSSIPDDTFGAAAIYCPADTGFPDDGIIVQGRFNELKMVIGQIDFEKIAFIRMNGRVQNYNDTTNSRELKIIVTTQCLLK
jgi:predicted amidohydrolase